MLAFPGMLVDAATQAGMKVPPDANNFDSNDYPHFAVFCAVQLGQPLNPGDHYYNAEVVAKVSDNEIMQVTFNDLIERGFSVGGYYN